MLTVAAIAIVLHAPGKSAISISLSKKMEGLHALVFCPAPTGSRVAVSTESGDNAVRIVDAATHQTIRTLIGHPQQVYAIAWSPDGDLIATGDESARIFIWNAQTGAKLQTITGHTKGIQNLSFNRSRTLLVSTGKDDAMMVWNVSTGKKAAEVLGHGLNLYSGCFNPVTDSLLVGTLAGGARTYRMTNSGAHVMNFLSFVNPTGQTHGVMDCSWSRDGTKAVTAANDGLAILWDMKTFKKIGTFKGHGDEIFRAGFSPNGKLVATGSFDRTVKVWDTNTFEPIATLSDESAVGSPVCFTSDGKYLLTTGVDDSLEFYAVSPSQGITRVDDAKPARHRRHH